MKLFLLFLFALILLAETWYNSREAHRHVHEIGCAIGASDNEDVPFCEWIK